MPTSMAISVLRWARATPVARLRRLSQRSRHWSGAPSAHSFCGLFLLRLLLHLQDLLPAAVAGEAVLVEEQHRPVAEAQLFGVLQRRRGAMHHAVGLLLEVARTVG